MFRKLLISTLIVVVALITFSSQIAAQTPEIGVFFDREGTTQSIDLSNLPGQAYITAFVVAKNWPKFHSFEFGIYVTNPYQIMSSVILENASCEYGQVLDQLCCTPGCTERADPLIVVKVNLYIYTQVSNFKIWIGPSSNPESYNEPRVAICSNNNAEIVTLSPSPFGAGCAVINPDTSSPVENTSWGAIKALYSN